MTASAVPDHRRFNNTLKYQRELFAQLPEGARTALDVGCGEGIAARELAAAGLTVTALDVDAPSLERARAQATDGIEYREADVMTATLDPAGYDVVYAGAMLHHLELEPALERLRDLVAPGGALLVVGLAMSRWPRDIPYEMAASVAASAWSLVKGKWEHGSPLVWPPPHSYDDVREAVATILPGAEYQRHLLWRYTVRWDRPRG